MASIQSSIVVFRMMPHHRALAADGSQKLRIAHVRLKGTD
jgi:hypothetical protein